MSDIETSLIPGERIVCKARMHLVAYVNNLLLMIGMLSVGWFIGMPAAELVLTDKRVIGKSGRKRLDLPHKAIASARARQSLLGQLLGYGNLIITGNDGSKIKFRGIADPVDMQIQIEEAVEMAVLGRVLSQVNKF